MSTDRAPARRRMSARRRELIGYMELRYYLNDPMDPRNSDKMAGQESWHVTLVDALGTGEPAGWSTVHRVPLRNGDWLDNESDAAPFIPGWPVGVVSDGFDGLSKKVIRRLELDYPCRGDAFLVVEHVSLIEPWQRLRLEALFLARILVRLVDATILFATAEPKYDHPEGFRRKVQPSLEAEVAELGFEPFERGVWLADLHDLKERNSQICRRFGVSTERSRYDID